MDSARFSRRELALLIAVPLVWAVLLLFHPTGDGETITYADVQDVVTRWLVVHIGMLIFIPLMAAVVYLLVRGIESTTASICLALRAAMLAGIAPKGTAWMPSWPQPSWIAICLASQSLSDPVVETAIRFPFRSAMLLMGESRSTMAAMLRASMPHSRTM